MPEPTNRLANWLHRVVALKLPPDVEKCAHEYVFTHVFARFRSDEELKRLRRSFRTTRKIERWGASHCTRMELMIGGCLALRELGLAAYEKPKVRKRTKK